MLEEWVRCPSKTTNEDNIEHDRYMILLDEWLLTDILHAN
jgi:hypothetical protein